MDRARVEYPAHARDGLCPAHPWLHRPAARAAMPRARRGPGVLVLAEERGHVKKVPRIRLEKEPEGRLRFLTADEISRLMAACEASEHPELATIVTLAFNTGMRKGEILGLSWDCVDFSRGVLLLERTKSGRRREVPMNDVVYPALSKRPGSREGSVFLSRSMRTAFDKGVEAAKLEGFRFHDLRHTAAS